MEERLPGMTMLMTLLLVMTSVMTVQSYKTLVPYVEYLPLSDRCKDVQGCPLPGNKCLNVNEERTIDCVTYRCDTYEDGYRLSTSTACAVTDGQCLFINPGKPQIVDCVHYICRRFANVSFLLMDRACSLPNGECLDFGETKTVGCVRYTCRETRDTVTSSTNGDCLQSYGTCLPEGQTGLCYSNYSLCTWFAKSCRVAHRNSTTQ